MRNWELERRDLLKCLGVGLGCLPLLRAGNAIGAGSDTKRLIIVMNTNGYRQAFWRPKDGSILNGPLPETNAPLEPHKDRLMFLPDLLQPAYGGRGHGSYVSCLASGPNDSKGEYRVPFTPTIDQIIGQPLAMKANLSRPSLPLGIQIEGGNAGIFPSQRMCWKDRNSPITPEEDIYKAYADVFGGMRPMTVVDDRAVKSLMAHKKSLLDYVGRSLTRFKDRLGKDDREAIDSHLTSVRGLETQLATPRPDATQCGKNPGNPVDVRAGGNYPTLMSLSFDLMVAALRCDVTRIATLAPCDASGSNIPFSWVPEARRGWHSMGHNPMSGATDNKKFADRWLMGQFASLIERLKNVPEPGGTMLDSTVILWANHMEEGHTHNSQRTPWMLAGNVGNYFRTGQCVASTGRPVNGVLYHLCHAMGEPVEYVGSPEFGRSWDGMTN